MRQAVCAKVVSMLTRWLVGRRLCRSVLTPDARLVRSMCVTLISYREAIDRLLAPLTALPSQSCVLADALGRILTQPVSGSVALPSFNHAAMDGYALHAAGPLEPGSEYLVRGSQAAGDEIRIAHGGAWEMMTGARLPDGLDSVVAVERIELLETLPDGTPRRIRLRDEVYAGQNVLYAGTDIALGARVLAAGERIDSPQVMLLAALGVARVEVVCRPRVAIICTGKELQSDPTQPLGDGQIYSSNGPYLVAALSRAGAKVLCCETVDDTAVTYVQALQRAVAAGADLVISTGAVSMGRYDFVPDALRRLDAELLFHKVAMRPGKPLLAARLPDGPLILALPGTPMAVAAGARFFVAPVLRALAGQRREPVLHASLATAQSPKPGFRYFLRATLQLDGTGRLLAHVNRQQEPFRIRPFAESEAWVVLGEDAGDCPAGTPVEIASLELGSSLRIGNDR
jgi:molybdopterin molybdotransferase